VFWRENGVVSLGFGPDQVTENRTMAEIAPFDAIISFYSQALMKDLEGGVIVEPVGKLTCTSGTERSFISGITSPTTPNNGWREFHHLKYPSFLVFVQAHRHGATTNRFLDSAAVSPSRSRPIHIRSISASYRALRTALHNDNTGYYCVIGRENKLHYSGKH
jgi:hypothetical protein